MPDSRAAIVQLVEQDMRRALRYLPKVEGDTVGRAAWVRTRVSQQMWEMFYPSLSFISSEDEAITLMSWWRKTAEVWQLERWCVVLEVPDGLTKRRTEFTLTKFGEALAPTEVTPWPFDLTEI